MEEMNIDLTKVREVVDRGRRMRVILDELRADALRLRNEDETRWAQNKAVLQSMRENPSKETALAYIEHLDWLTSMTNYEARSAISDKRSALLKELRGVQDELHRMLGIGMTNDDLSTP